MKKALLTMMAVVIAMSSAAFADTSTQKAARIDRIEKQIQELSKDISALEKAQAEGTIYSEAVGKHMVILMGATALSVMKIGKAMQAGKMSRGVTVEAIGQYGATVAAGEGAVVCIDIYTLGKILDSKRAQLNSLQSQLDALTDK